MSMTAQRNGTTPHTKVALRVVIADDHPFYRDGLAKLLGANGIHVAAQAANGEAAIRAVAENAPDVVVMDLNMPGMSGLEATRKLTEIAPHTRVLILSVSAQEEDVTEAILAGASGYVLKESPVEEVVAGIQAAAAGQALISPRIATLLLGRLREHAQAQREVTTMHLSGRELDVLGLLADGKANHEIAEALYISPSTVRNHVANILAKLHVDNRVQAAVRAVRGRIV
jgi:DNA-binding NarL/FixJ family response regulator